jgi:type VI secretion system protein VasJ
MDDALLLLGENPISKDSPTGESVRYETEFEELQEEMAKLESLRDESIDWEKVIENSTLILTTMSKDFLVASYLCHALFETKGYTGLEAGLTILRDMVNTFWDDMYPEQKRLRARISATKWLVDRLAVNLPKQKPGLDKAEVVDSSTKLAKEFEQLLEEKLGDDNPTGDEVPLWGELHRTLRDHDQTIKQAKAKLEKAAAPPAETESQTTQATQQESSSEAKPATAAATTPAAPQQIASEQDADRTLRACKDMLKKVAAYRRERKLADPQSYYLLRMAVWADVELPTTQNGTTQVRQPIEEKVTYLNKLLEDANYQELINEVEQSFAGAPFWLDLHRYIATGLEALGHTEALSAVTETLAMLLRRFPSLPECKFVGGQSFADDQTQAWIQASVLSGGGQHSVSMFSAGSSTSGTAGLQETGNEARVLAAKGDFRQAVELLKEGRKLAGTGRDQFLWDLQEARFWQEAGQIEIAVSQLETLDEGTEGAFLEYWEPELSFQIAALLLVWYKRMESKGPLPPERIARKERMRSRVSRLDGVRAMDLVGKDK